MDEDETPVFEIVSRADGSVIFRGHVKMLDDGFEMPIPDEIMALMAGGDNFDIRFTPVVILPSKLTDP